MTESNIGRSEQRPYRPPVMVSPSNHERFECGWRYNGSEGSYGYRNPV
jgi:hypothetical protein